MTFLRWLVWALSVLASAQALALTEGEAGDVASILGRLESEGQQRILSASTGTTGPKQVLRGVRFYANDRTKVGYLVLLDSSIDMEAKQARIIYRLTDFGLLGRNGKVSVPQPMPGIQECKKYIAEGKVCTSLYATLLTNERDLNQTVLAQGRLDNGNLLLVMANKNMDTDVDRDLRPGFVLESTPLGATFTKLILVAVKER